MSDTKEFLEYIKKERQQFTNSQWQEWLLLSPDKRVIVENLLIAYDQMSDRLSRIQNIATENKQGWVKAYKEMPKDSELVLLFGEVVFMGYRLNGNWFHYHNQGEQDPYVINDITHWMPLPSKPTNI